MVLNIFDMDGVLVDSSKRFRPLAGSNPPRIDLEYWRSNENSPKVCQDQFLPTFYREYLPSIDNPRCCTVIATARTIYDADRFFLNHHMPMPDYLISRHGPGDNRGGVEIKVLGIRALLQRFLDYPDCINLWEDNLDYLNGIKAAFPDIGTNYVPSNQGF